MDSILIAVSTATDGSMSKAVDDEERRRNRERFLGLNGIASDHTVLVHLEYEGDNYRRYHVVDGGNGGEGILRPSRHIADALFTTTKGLALFLPVADCIGAVLHDPRNSVFGLAHFGRHNLEQQGGQETIAFMRREFGSHPADVRVFLGPGAGKLRYPLFSFGGKSLEEVTREQLMDIGVTAEHISSDGRDTTRDAGLFSHSEFLKGNRTTDGRQAIIAMMRH